MPRCKQPKALPRDCVCVMLALHVFAMLRLSVLKLLTTQWSLPASDPQAWQRIFTRAWVSASYWQSLYRFSLFTSWPWSWIAVPVVIKMSSQREKNDPPDCQLRRLSTWHDAAVVFYSDVLSCLYSFITFSAWEKKYVFIKLLNSLKNSIMMDLWQGKVTWDEMAALHHYHKHFLTNRIKELTDN